MRQLRINMYVLMGAIAAMTFLVCGGTYLALARNGWAVASEHGACARAIICFSDRQDSTSDRKQDGAALGTWTPPWVGLPADRPTTR